MNLRLPILLLALDAAPHLPMPTIFFDAGTFGGFSFSIPGYLSSFFNSSRVRGHHEVAHADTQVGTNVQTR